MFLTFSRQRSRAITSLPPLELSLPTSTSEIRCWDKPPSVSEPSILKHLRSTSSSGAFQWKRVWVNKRLWKRVIWVPTEYICSARTLLTMLHPDQEQSVRGVPFPRISFVPNTVLPDNIVYVAPAGCANGTFCFPVSTINLLENTAQSWYDAGYVNVRRRYARGLTSSPTIRGRKISATHTDFRSPMFESAIPQNNNDLGSGEGTGLRRQTPFRVECGIQPSWLEAIGLARANHQKLASLHRVSNSDRLSLSRFQCSETRLTPVPCWGENPIRANVTGQPSFHPAPKPRRPGSTQRHLPRHQPSALAMQAVTRSMGRDCRLWTSR